MLSQPSLMPFVMKRVIAAALSLGLASCVASDRHNFLLGGVEAQQIHRDTWLLVQRGNDFPSQAALADFVMLQAAQTTIAHGGTHFIVLPPSELPPMRSVTTGLVVHPVRPIEDIRIVRVRRGGRPPAGAFDADYTLRLVRAKLVGP